MYSRISAIVVSRRFRRTGAVRGPVLHALGARMPALAPRSTLARRLPPVRVWRRLTWPPALLDAVSAAIMHCDNRVVGERLNP